MGCPKGFSRNMEETKSKDLRLQPGYWKQLLSTHDQIYQSKRNIWSIHGKKAVEMPERAEIGSNKYSNMRYDDKSNANLDLDDFLVKAYAKQIKELNSSTAMARVTMARAAVSMRPSAHSPLDNVSTKYNPIRLLKGAPPGQDKVNFYASELGISRMHREKQKKKNDHHLFGIEAYGDYDYHHNFFEGAVNRDMRFWEPELVRNYTKMI